MTDARQAATDTVEVALAVPLRDGRLLVARRAPGSHLEGVWEFPGGKIRPDEQPSHAAERELREETALVATDVEPLVVVVHEYPECTVRLHVFLARDPQGEVEPDAPREVAWKTLDELQDLEMPAANAQILRALHWRLR